MNPLVSIIIPCHNAAPWLAATLESAVAQTWGQREIIVIDDGSTDGSAAIAETFAPRGVRTVRQPNRNASSARNHGLRLAGGEYIQFLDADDLITPDKIAAQVAILQASPRHTVASCRWGRFATDPAQSRFVDEAVFRDYIPAREFLIQAAGTGDMMQPAAWLCPRELLETAGPWDEGLTLNDDGEYFARVLVGSPGVRFAAAGRVCYRSAVAGSLSRRHSAAAMASLFRSYDGFAAQLLAAEDSPRVRAALANFWERGRFELYPWSPALSDAAGRRARQLGRPSVAAPIGPRLRLIARIFGWKAARRLQQRGRS